MGGFDRNQHTSGNYATSSESVTVDNTAPSISSIATSSVATSTATITWTTNEAATSQINYGTTASYGASSSSAALVTSHSITLTGLTASTTYDFQIQSADAVGNTATSSNKTLTTQTGLLGVNISGPEFAPWNGQAFPNNADFAYLASKGVTFVRMPIAWESLQPTLATTLNSTYLGKIQSAIAAAHSYGIGVIVDLHNFGAYCQQADWTSSGCGYAGNAGSTGTGVNFLGDGTLTQADFTDLWTRLATALVGTPGLIGYEIMNEPNINLLQYGTNLLFAPNGFGDSVGSQPWFMTNGGVVTQLANGTNPLSSSYGPAWSLTSGTGFGGFNQNLTLSNTAYTLSCYAKTPSGTDSTFQFAIGGSASSDFTVTTTWTRFSYSHTPSAGSVEVSAFLGSGSAHLIDVADCQLEAGSSATTYKPNVWLPYAQAAITAIRGVDASTPIYVNGFNNGTAYLWPWENWDLASLTGGNIVFDAHQYFDGSVSNGGGGGTYSGTYSSYSITSTAGVSEVTPFESWVASTSVSSVIGEYAIPDNSKGDQASWLPVMANFIQSLIGNNIPSAMWFYGANGIQKSNNLNIATSTTANAGSDDSRLIQLLEQY